MAEVKLKTTWLLQSAARQETAINKRYMYSYISNQLIELPTTKNYMHDCVLVPFWKNAGKVIVFFVLTVL